MTDAPPHDVHVDAALARRLVAEQHPDLVGDVREVAHGWDNVILRLGDRYAIRMPRRELGAALVPGELRWLPDLAERLPVPIPAPIRAGAPGLGYPYPWSIVPWFDGVDPARTEPAARAGAAAGLAGFVVALGSPAPVDAPANPYRGVPLAERDEVVRARLGSVAHGEPIGADDFGPGAVERLADVWDAALAAPAWTGDPVWVHGDLHPANLLLDEDGHLAAVLDFGDLTSGDPATDLATAWLTFDTSGRSRFRAAVDASGRYGDADWVRARGWACALGLAIVTAVGVEGRVGRIGAHALREVLAD